MAKTLREISFESVEKRFKLASYWFGTTWCPAVDKREGDGYQIRILAGEKRHGNGEVTTSYDYFYLSYDGGVLTAPRGYARDYKPARITGLAEAVERYAAVRRG